MKQLYLVRHAQTHYDASVADDARELTQTGRSQAAALVDVLHGLGIEEIHTSPYRRCLDTIAPFAAAAALQLNHVDDLRERCFTAAEVPDWASLWRRVWSDFDYAFADGESSRQAQNRMVEATLALAAKSPARTLAISSHGNTIGLLLHHIDSRFTFEHATALRNPDVLRVTFDGGMLRWDAEFAVPAIEAFATRFAATALPSTIRTAARPPLR